MLDELGRWRVVGEAEGEVVVFADCPQMNPEDAVRLALVVVRTKHPAISDDLLRFRCQRVDAASEVHFVVDGGRAKRLTN